MRAGRFQLISSTYHNCRLQHYFEAATVTNVGQRNKGILPTIVAAVVQAETIPAAMRPGLTLREAVLNSSALLGENEVYRPWSVVIPIIRALKNSPIPAKMILNRNSSSSHDYEQWTHQQLKMTRTLPDQRGTPWSRGATHLRHSQHLEEESVLSYSD